MSFFTLQFVGFMLAAVLCYYVIPQRFRWLVLLAASYVFYMIGGWRVVFYLLFTTGVTYTAGRVLGAFNSKISETPKEEADVRKKWKKRKTMVAALSILAAFGVLFVLRYLDFTLEFLTSSDRFSLNLIIPLGVSFYTFQSVGYVIDVYRAKHTPEKNLLKYALFVSFFPQMIQGPISRFHQLAPQLVEGSKLDFKNIQHGIQLAMWGYFKKLVIADRAAVVVDLVYADSGAFNGTMVAFAVFLYCIQLYCDFSGGIDITRGIAKMFGIELMENFRRPIFSTSLLDFWRRWHITLGAWLKDYLFYALALSKPIVRLGKFTRGRFKGTLGKLIPTAICTFIVYFTIGIWHGANFRWIVFGLWNASIITISFLLAGTFASWKDRLNIRDDSLYWRIFSIMRTMLIVFIGRYVTRAPRFLAGITMLWQTISDFSIRSLFNGSLYTLGLSRFDTWVVLFGILTVVTLEFFQERGVRIRETLDSRGFFVQWAAILFPIAAILFLGILGWNYDSPQFIYAQF